MSTKPMPLVIFSKQYFLQSCKYLTRSSLCPCKFSIVETALLVGQLIDNLTFILMPQVLLLPRNNYNVPSEFSLVKGLIHAQACDVQHVL